jgi:molybdenum cofactor cytidylyltransferase
MTVEGLALVVLAAGMSERMQGRNKLLMRVNGRALVSRSLDAVRDIEARRKILVTGRDGEEVARLAECGADWTLIANTEPDRGMSHSLKLALRAAVPCQAALIVLADMAFVEAHVVEALLKAFKPEAYACIPAYDGQWGNPILLGPQAITDCEELSGDKGARHLLRLRAQDCIEVATDCVGVLRDFDVPEDFLTSD